MPSGENSATVAIAGASGFVGRALASALRGTHDVIGLSRGRHAPSDAGPHRWRQCDMFSLIEIERALIGVDVAVYLVHSMLPSARMTQARFEDLDLILADNFARACARAGVRHIVYLGGLVPQGGALSTHLRSRLEVEDALGGHGVAVTALRAGLIVGSEGSSFQMLVRLVQRLPAMLCPKWTRTKTQPIALSDVIALLAYSVNHPGAGRRAFDIGGPDVLSYRQMLADVAQALGKKPWLAPAPLFSPRLSRLWVSVVTGTSGKLVGPLVESLRHEMLATDRELQRRAKIPGLTWKESLALALRPTVEPSESSSPKKVKAVRSAPRIAAGVRSVQRLPRPPGSDAKAIAYEYLAWLPNALWPWIVVARRHGQIELVVRGLGIRLLALRPSVDRTTEDRALFYVSGGVLAGREPRGRLEFRIAPDGASVLAAVHDFAPRLPWPIYRVTQALAHAWVMWRFGGHLRRSRGVAALHRANHPAAER